MGGPNPIERGTADRGLSIDPAVEAYHTEPRRLVELVRKSFKENSIIAEIEARDAVEYGVPLRQVWETQPEKWDDPLHRWIFLRHYIRWYHWTRDHKVLSDEELLQQILVQEREYQRLLRVSRQGWLVRRFPHYVEALQRQEEQELKEFLEEVDAIGQQEQLERRIQGMRVHSTRIQSAILHSAGGIEPIYELLQEVAPVVSMALDFVPLVGQIKGIAEAAIGRDLITGEELPLWARGVGAAFSLVPFAKGIFSVVRGGLRVVSQVSRLRRLAAVAYQLRLLRKIEPREVYRLIKRLSSLSKETEESLRVASRIPADRPLTAGQKAAVKEFVKAFPDVPAESATRLSRSASGVIENGRGLQRAESGTILPKAVAPARATAKAAPKIVQELVAKGYLPEAIEALQSAGVEITRKLVSRLDKLGETGPRFLNLFHRSVGFHRVLEDLAIGGSIVRGKARGARFVMRYATSHLDIVAKVQRNPALIAFEWGVGHYKQVTGVERVAREVDIVVRGDRTIGVGDTIYKELKSWTAQSLELSETKVQQQLSRDLALLDPQNIRWVFDSTEIADKNDIIEAFVRVIEKDPNLFTKVWGNDPDRIRAALERVVELYP